MGVRDELLHLLKIIEKMTKNKSNPIIIIVAIVVIVFLFLKTGGFIGSVFTNTILFKGNNYGIIGGDTTGTCSFNSQITSSDTEIRGSLSAGSCSANGERGIESTDLNLNVKNFKALFSGTITGSGREDGWADASMSVRLSDGINSVNLASRSLASYRGTKSISNIIYEKIDSTNALVQGEGVIDISALDKTKPWQLYISSSLSSRNPSDMVASASFSYAGVIDIVSEEMSRQAQIIILPIPQIQGNILPDKSFSWSTKIDVSQVVPGSSMDLIYRIKASDASDGLEPIYKEYDFKFKRQ